MMQKPLTTLMATCATSWPSGDCGSWPSGPLPRSELHRGASIAPRRRTAGALRRRARQIEAANVLMRSPSSRSTVPASWNERGSSSDCRGSGPGISCWFRPRSQPPPTLSDNPLKASRDWSCGRTTLPRTSQGTPSAPILWSRRPRGPQPASPDGRFRPTPRPRPAPTFRRRTTSAPSPEASALEARDVPQQRTQHGTLRDPTVHRPFSHPPAKDGVDDASVPEKCPDHTPQILGYSMNLEGRAYPVPGDAVVGVVHV